MNRLRTALIFTGRVEWRLLLFLLLFLDVKLIVKCTALVVLFFMQPDFHFGFDFKKTRLPLFYPAMIMIGILTYFLNADFSASYLLVFTFGIAIWVACILSVHQLQLFVEKTEIAVLHNTLYLFFLCNIIVSFLNLGIIFLEIGIRNPFTYQGDFQKYFMNTGDHIKGISFDSSTTNAVINLFAIVYFLYRKQFAMLIASMVILLITASNMVNLLLVFSLITIFIFYSDRVQKSVIVVCLFMLIIFMAKVSPQNDMYISRMFNEYVLNKTTNVTAAAIQEPIPLRERPDSQLDENSKKEKIALLYLDSIERIKQQQQLPSASINTIAVNEYERPLVPGDSIHTATFQSSRDTTKVQKAVLRFMIERLGASYANGINMDRTGKMTSFLQSVSFLLHHPAKLLFGNGIGNFSSKLAFKATALNLSGGFPQSFVYVHPDFLQHHLRLHAFYYTRHASVHSVVHSPASVYNQLPTEYGLLGMAAFIFLYAGFFLRQWKKLSYGIVLLCLLSAIFITDYWFEQLSVVCLLELMLFINIKENTIQKETHA